MKFLETMYLYNFFVGYEIISYELNLTCWYRFML